MFTTYTHKNISVTWLHHASFLMKTGEMVVYVDPFEVRETQSFQTIVPADFIFLTHDHYDHTDAASIALIRATHTRVIGSVNLKKKNLADECLASGESFRTHELEATAVASYNLEKQFHKKESGNAGFLIRLGEVAVYHPGDTDLIPEMRTLRGIDVFLVPIGGTYTMDAAAAVQAVALIKPQVVIPMHFNYVEGTEVSPEQLEFFRTEAGKYAGSVIVLEAAIPKGENPKS